MYWSTVLVSFFCRMLNIAIFRMFHSFRLSIELGYFYENIKFCSLVFQGEIQAFENFHGVFSDARYVTVLNSSSNRLSRATTAQLSDVRLNSFQLDVKFLSVFSRFGIMLSRLVIMTELRYLMCLSLYMLLRSYSLEGRRLAWLYFYALFCNHSSDISSFV